MPRGGPRPGSGPKKRRPSERAHPEYAERLRQRIQAGIIVARMNAAAIGELEIADAQVESVRKGYAEILMRKVLPDLDRTELTGAAGGPLVIVTRME